MEAQRRQMRNEEKRASRLEERERTAYNLHDVTGHQKTAIALKVWEENTLTVGKKYVSH